jgi:Putative amidoligase enzyme.
MTSTFLSKYIGAYEKPNKDPIPGRKLSLPVAPRTVSGDVGLELEIEAVGLLSADRLADLRSPTTGVTWQTHTDGSLRGSAIEYVLSSPVNIDEVPFMVEGLYERLARNGIRWNLSNRCSTHVHANMGGKKINELTSVIALWTTFEDILIEWCGAERVNNHFCLPAKESTFNISTWDRLLSKGRWEFNDGAKYTALNLRSIGQIGSFEFRSMRASETPGPIIDWTKIVHGIVDYAGKNYQNPQSIASAVSEMGGPELFVEICRTAGVSDQTVDEILALPNIRARTFEGFRLAQPIVLGYPWHEWMEEFDKSYIPDPFSKSSSAQGSWLALNTRAGEVPLRAAAAPLENAINALERDRRRRADTNPRWVINPAGTDERPARAFRYPEGWEPAVVDTDRPVMFADGTLAEVNRVDGHLFRARSREPLTAEGINLHNWYYYRTDTGYFEGQPAVAAIQNVPEDMG